MRSNQARSGVVLMIVLGVMLVISILIVVILTLMTNESRIAEHKIRRMRVFYAAQAGMVHALDRLRQDGTDAATLADINDDDPDIGDSADPGYPVSTHIEIEASGASVDCPADSPSDFCVAIDAP